MRCFGKRKNRASVLADSSVVSQLSRLFSSGSFLSLTEFVSAAPLPSSLLQLLGKKSLRDPQKLQAPTSSFEESSQRLQWRGLSCGGHQVEEINTSPVLSPFEFQLFFTLPLSLTPKSNNQSQLCLPHGRARQQEKARNLGFLTRNLGTPQEAFPFSLYELQFRIPLRCIFKEITDF